MLVLADRILMTCWFLQIDPPEAAIPLPAVEGAILELVIKYCQYHYDNKETKEEEKNNW